MNSLLSKLPKPTSNQEGFPWTIETSPTIYSNNVIYPKITIVTPSYNQGQFLEETIRSVLLQNYPNLEYIIIDGGSTDNSVEIIKKYEQWIHYWVSEPDSGQTAAINKGIAVATGTVFNWLNSDDSYLENAFWNVGEAFLNPQLRVALFQEFLVQNNQIIQTTEGTSLSETLEATLVHLHLDQPCTFFDLNALKQIGKLQEQLHYLFDAEMWIRFLLIHGLENIQRFDVPINNFRLHTDSKTVAFDYKFQEEIYILLSTLLKLSSVDNRIKQHFRNQDTLSKEIFKTWAKPNLDLKKFNHHLINRLGLYAFRSKDKDLIRLIPMQKPFVKKTYYKAFWYRKLTLLLSNYQIDILNTIWKKIF